MVGLQLERIRVVLSLQIFCRSASKKNRASFSDELWLLVHTLAITERKYCGILWAIYQKMGILIEHSRSQGAHPLTNSTTRVIFGIPTILTHPSQERDRLSSIPIKAEPIWPRHRVCRPWCEFLVLINQQSDIKTPPYDRAQLIWSGVQHWRTIHKISAFHK